MFEYIERTPALKDVLVTGGDLYTLSPDQTILDEKEAAAFDYPFHKIVLGQGVVIAENLTNLEAIRRGNWVVSLVPLKLIGSDGSPIRACAWKQGTF